MKQVSYQLLQYRFPNPYEDIKKVETENGFYASSGLLYAMAEFGRDQRQLGVDALVFDPTISKKVIRSLVRRQAFKRNDITEAQPGKFHHEYRQRIADQLATKEYQEIFSYLSLRWGIKKDKITYYGSYDITPDTVSLIADVAREDKTILSEKIRNDDKGKYISVKESAKEGIQWVQDRILYGPTTTPHNDIVGKFLQKSNLSQFIPMYHHRILHSLDRLKHTITNPLPLLKTKRIKLLEFQRVNKNGITYQGWMDGGTSLIHSSHSLEGILANFTKPIATIEIQASAYDALRKAAFLFPKKSKHFQRLAHEIRDNVFRFFWMDKEKYFGMAVDRDSQNNLRLLRTLAATPGEMLNTSFFTDLTEKEKEYYISSVVKMLFSKNFLTPAGIRTRAKSQAYLSGKLWDYQGSKTSWIVQTGRIAEGLRRWGLYKLCEQLENRILNTVSIFGYNVEYVYVGALGECENVVAYNMAEKGKPLAAIPQTKIVEIPATNIPEFTQTWTASKVAAIKHRKKHTHFQPPIQKFSWQQHLEDEILTSLHSRGEMISLLESPYEILAKRNNGFLFVVDKIQGKKLEEQLIKKSEIFHQT